jgi:predicted 3-demethylubiquinone-9 3-methyltransferase (glyoxalase superfamily)
MPKQIPCLWFDGQAEDAAQLYISAFPNSQITRVTRYGPAGPGPAGSVMTVEFTLDGTEYLALNGGPEFHFTEAVSFQIMCADQEEIDHYWYSLSEGGEQGPCGWLKDRFGLSWQVTPTVLSELINDPDPGRSQRAMQAMLGMKKIDIAEIRSAADG